VTIGRCAARRGRAAAIACGLAAPAPASAPDQTRRELARETARGTKGVVELHDLLRLQ
jgi:hypothetical protein